MNRSDIYAIIDSEREYQDSEWPGSPHNHTLLEFSVYMKDYLDELQHLISRTPDNVRSSNAVMDIMRKVTAMGIACMEIHGARERVPQIASL